MTCNQNAVYLLGDTTECHAVDGFIVSNALLKGCSDLSIIEEECPAVWEACQSGASQSVFKVTSSMKANLGKTSDSYSPRTY